MEDLEKLEDVLVERLRAIRNIENKTLNDREEYKNIQETLRKIYDIKIMIDRLKKEGI